MCSLFIGNISSIYEAITKAPMDIAYNFVAIQPKRYVGEAHYSYADNYSHSHHYVLQTTGNNH